MRCLAALLLLLPALALGAVSPSETHLCPYSTEVFEIDVGQGAYSISAGGSAGQWATIAEEKGASDGSPVPIFLTVPKDTLTGEYSLVVEINGASEAATIFVDECFGIEVGADKEEVSLCKGEASRIMASVRNIGKYREAFSVDVDGEQKEAIELGPGGETAIDIPVQAGNSIGKASLLVEVVGMESGTRVGKSIVIDTQDCYKTSVVGPNNYDYCAEDGGELALRVLNSGPRGGTYTAAISGASAEFERDFEIGPESEKELLLVFRGNAAGSYTVALALESEGGASTKEFALRVDDCYGFEIEGESFVACPGDEVKFPITIRNTGTNAGKYGISVENKLSESKEIETELEAGSSKELHYSFVLPAESASGKYEISITVAAEYGEEHVESVEYEVAEPDTCHSLIIEGKDAITIEKGAGELVEIELTNQGLVSENLVLSADVEWAILKPEIISIGPGDSKTVFLYLGPSFEVDAAEYSVVVSAAGVHVMADKGLKVTVVKENSYSPTGLLSLPKISTGLSKIRPSLPDMAPELKGEPISIKLIAYFLAGLGLTIVVLLAGLILWEK